MELELTDGTIVLISDEDAHLAEYHWHPLKTKGKVYAQRCDYSDPKHPRKLLLHRCIMNAPEGMCVDHISGVTTDCRRKNLRLATYSENLTNSRKTRTRPCTSQYKGVTRRNTGTWSIRLTKNGVRHYKGGFKNEVEAAKAADQMAILLFGEFAHLNFPTQQAECSYVADCVVALAAEPLCVLHKGA